MDIDSSSSAYSFSSTFPLPFRVLFLSFSTILAFATNLHYLSYLGINTSLVLDIKSSLSDEAEENVNGFQNRLATQYVQPSRLYSPIYKLAITGLAWTTFGWVLFSWITGGEPAEMVKWRGIPAFVAIVVGGATVAPWNVLHRKERMMFLRALKRTIFSPLRSAVPFSDIILADILTSSAKVLGDVWVSGCLLTTVTENFGMGDANGASGCARIWMVPFMTSLPYLFRFRQCLSEVVTGSTPTPQKSIMNAVKYASAFPVILFSALQTATGDPSYEIVAGQEGWMGKDLVFSLWVLSVFINSLYSFWWDVTNDWGLSLLTPAGWSNTPAISYAFIQPSSSARRSFSRPSTTRAHARIWNSGNQTPPTNALPSPALNLPLSASDFSSAPGTSRPSTPGLEFNSRVYHHSTNSVPHITSNLRTPSTNNNTLNSKAYSTSSSPNIAFPFLRPILLLPDPLIYYLAISIDLILRFTWSLKLSSHLHSIHEIESGIFLMEALEVLRRWMWVFLRIEWEAVRKGAGGSGSSDGGRGFEDEEEMEMGNRSELVGGSYMDIETGTGGGRMGSSSGKSESGLGILGG